jgi:hypothetical protein
MFKMTDAEKLNYLKVACSHLGLHFLQFSLKGMMDSPLGKSKGEGTEKYETSVIGVLKK